MFQFYRFFFQFFTRILSGKMNDKNYYDLALRMMIHE